MNKITTQADALLARARRLLHDHRTRARKSGAVLDYTLADVRHLLAAHPQCEFCGTPLTFAASVDHRTPIARGGRHQLANLAVCCQRCNALKGQLTEGEFREIVTALARLHPTAQADLERRLLAGGKRYGSTSP
jgi:5-methylcytosine-specific restriction endonuclease McrA